MKVKIIFDRHTHDFFLGENGKNTLGPIPNLSSSPHAQCHWTSSPWHILFAVVRKRDFFSSICGRTFMADREEKAMAEAGFIDVRMKKKNEHVNSPPPPARHPSNFFFSPQFRDLIDIREGQSERAIQEGQKWEVDGNMWTSTRRLVTRSSQWAKKKIGLKMRAGIGPLTQNGLIWREFCPLTVAKVQKGGFHSCQRLSKSRLRAVTAIHLTGSKPPHLAEMGAVFHRRDRNSQSSTVVKSYPDCSQNQFMPG